MEENKEKRKKCSFKCSTCHNYNKKIDFCREKGINDCSKQIHTDFSQCESYLINEKLVMF